MEIYDFSMHRGATFHRALLFRKGGEVLYLTGYEAKCQVRECPDGGALLCEMECTITPAAGRIDLLIPASVSSGFTSGLYAWDIRVTSPASVAEYYLGGAFKVLPSVTE